MSLSSAASARRRRLVLLTLAVTLASLAIRLPTAHAESVARILAPSSGGVAQVGVPLVITGTAANGEGEFADLVQVTLDGGTSWQDVAGIWVWSLVYTPSDPGELTIMVRTRWDDNFAYGADVVHVTVGDPSRPPPAVACPCTMPLPYVLGATPLGPDPDTSPVEVGVRFQLDRPGYISGVQVQRYPFTDPIEAHVWSPDGTLLATTGLPAMQNAPQRIAFTPPVPVQAGEIYTVSYFTAAGHYDASPDFFIGAMVVPPFRTVFDEVGGAGVYQYGDGPSFPTLTWNNANYWIAPIFSVQL